MKNGLENLGEEWAVEIAAQAILNNL